MFYLPILPKTLRVQSLNPHIRNICTFRLYLLH
nr:MAG TPA: hypothetical protein [Caudoviricetes sp.]